MRPWLDFLDGLAQVMGWKKSNNLPCGCAIFLLSYETNFLKSHSIFYKTVCFCTLDDFDSGFADMTTH